MAYYRRRTRRRSSGYRSRAGGYRRSYRGSSYGRRRRTARRAPARVVIQVVGSANGVTASPVSIGMKQRRVVRARY